ncbi:hypothetical protein H4R33_001631 [Dimargaris cristalligena]|nr:hypothetical protein H4R33_001631 [Dimargaris cristalligena]
MDVQNMYQDDPLLQLSPHNIVNQWKYGIKWRQDGQLWASACAVLVIAGEFGKVRGLMEKNRQYIKPRWYSYAAMLLLEFGDFPPDQEVKIAGGITTNCGYADALGFSMAEEKCTRAPRVRFNDTDTLSEMTGRGLVYVRRNSSGKPELAFRVRLPVARKLLKDNWLDLDETLVLDKSVLDDQLYLIKYREGFPPPRPSSQQ